MVKFNLGNATKRVEVIADATETLRDVLDAQGFATEGVTIHVDGVPTKDIDKTISALGITDGMMVMSVAQQKAGLQ